MAGGLSDDRCRPITLITTRRTTKSASKNHVCTLAFRMAAQEGRHVTASHIPPDLPHRRGADGRRARTWTATGGGVPYRLEDKRQSRMKKEASLVRLNVAQVHRRTTRAVVCSFKAITIKRT